MPDNRRVDDPAGVRWAIIDALRRYGTDSSRLGQVFAAAHQLQSPDVRALVAIMGAETDGAPLTAGRLRDHLGLSSGGTSLVIDRLEKAGHIRRTRDHPADNRVVHLRHTEQGMATGIAFFGPLGRRTEAILEQFSDEQLSVIERFITEAAGTLHEHLSDLESRPSASEPGTV